MLKRLVLLGLSVGALLGAEGARAGVIFQLVESGTTNVTEVFVNPGSLVGVDLLAASFNPEFGVDPELDSFTYRVEFPNEDFFLESNLFGLPFDNTLTGDGGFNGSIPWVSGSTPITNDADEGSPFDTPFIADIYRTTASETGVPGVGPDLLVETFELTAPLALGDYELSLNMLEAADRFGALHSTDNGDNFVIHVVPEPPTLIIGALGIMVGARRMWRVGG